MKILQADNQVLALQEQPRLAWLLGGSFAITGLLVLPLVFLFMPQYSLQCTRQAGEQGTCQITAQALVTQDSIDIPLSDLAGGKLQRYGGERSDEYLLQVLTRSGKVIDFGSYDSYVATNQRLDQLNRFLATPGQAELTLFQDERWVAWIITPIFFVVGIGLVIWMGTTLTIEFNKTLGTVTLRHQGLGGGNSEKSYPLADIESVIVERSHSSKGGDTYRVCLVMQSGKKVALRNYYSSGLGDKQATAAQIRQFLQLQD